MDAGRVERISEGRLPDDEFSPAERALAELVAKTTLRPATLEGRDLDAVALAYGERAAVDITGYLYSFHFINRIADFVGITSDVPIVQDRFPWLRRIGVRLQGAMMRRTMDLSAVEVSVDIDTVASRMERLFGPLPSGFDALRLAPNVAGLFGTVCDIAEGIDAELLERARGLVETYLPASDDEATGLHPRPADPLEAFAFVGTRYPARTTDDLVDRLRVSLNLDDPGLLDVFCAVAIANGLARASRLFDGTAALGRGESAAAV